MGEGEDDLNEEKEKYGEGDRKEKGEAEMEKEDDRLGRWRMGGGGERCKS